MIGSGRAPAYPEVWYDLIFRQLLSTTVPELPWTFTSPDGCFGRIGRRARLLHSSVLLIEKRRTTMRTDQPFLRRSALPSATRDTVAHPLVIIVDDDDSVREALSDLILSAGLPAVAFASTREL